MGALRQLAENEDGVVGLSYLSLGAFILSTVCCSGIAHKINRNWLQESMVFIIFGALTGLVAGLRRWGVGGGGGGGHPPPPSPHFPPPPAQTPPTRARAYSTTLAAH
jgi:hypothetical protein